MVVLSFLPAQKRRYLMFDPAHREDYVEYLEAEGQWEEAAKQLGICVNDEDFLSPHVRDTNNTHTFVYSCVEITLKDKMYEPPMYIPSAEDAWPFSQLFVFSLCFFMLLLQAS